MKLTRLNLEDSIIWVTVSFVATAASCLSLRAFLDPAFPEFSFVTRDRGREDLNLPVKQRRGAGFVLGNLSERCAVGGGKDLLATSMIFDRRYDKGP